MAENRRTKPEYGGFLPLELNPGREFFSLYEPYLKRFNSVKAGLDYLIKQIDKAKIYIPYYYCPSTIEAIRKMGKEIFFYHIDTELKPIGLHDDNDSIIILVDYFGVCSERVRECIRIIKNADVIVDCAHAFFEKPEIREKLHYVYSAKKFFGIPDGAYVVNAYKEPDEYQPITSHEYANYLLMTYEEGTNVAYAKKKAADKIIASDYECMSKLSIGLMQNVDYERVRKQRKSNYQTLINAFVKINDLSLPDVAVPYHFPLLIRKKGNAIKKELVKEHIYVPTLWAGEDLKQYGNEFETDMMNDCIFLPLDQRYNQEDMLFLVDAVFKNISL